MGEPWWTRLRNWLWLGAGYILAGAVLLVLADWLERR